MPANPVKAYEKLGTFYLGRRHDLARGQTLNEPLLYDAADLTTHAVCVGMTGSGKTGLCLGLLEEAAIDGIPALAIDPKGDLGNLMLTFPELRPADFRPWIDEREAARHGRDVAAHARVIADRWRRGLADWDQDGARIRRLKKSAEVAIYTPGGTAGLPLSVLRSFDPPAGTLDADALLDRLQAAVSGLLALLGIQADPLKSREHILLSTILSHAWRAGHGLDLPGLIRQIQKPPFDKVGVFDLESFFPANDRFELAVTLNNLLASPGFSAWTSGEPLDIGRLLYTDQGRPRIAILSIAHLPESERMFFVTLLLNEVLSWVRTQPGTSSLRALLYMDEIFGYFPPTAKPPSKQPMLTLLKQARAYGLGVVLATQNPVDLDYKGLSNTGTWFLGRLQTERDKARVLDGLEGASAQPGKGFGRREMDTVLSGLGSRVFLMHNVHEDAPVVFHTRWALSYLRGPLTRTQIRQLMADRQKPLPPAPPPPVPPAAGAPRPTSPAPPVADQDLPRPVLPGRVKEYFLPLNGAIGTRDRLVYRPALAATARLHYVSARARTDTWTRLSALLPLRDDDPAWEDAAIAQGREIELLDEPEAEAGYSALPNGAAVSTNYTAWKKMLVNHLYREWPLELLFCPDLKAYGEPGEAEGAFRGRLSHAAREARDLEANKLRRKYTPKLATVENRIRRAEQRVEKEREQYGQQKMQAAISIGATLIGAVLGRRVTGRATTAARGAGRAAGQRGDIGRAREELAVQQEKLKELEKDFEAAVEQLDTTWDPAGLAVEKAPLRPRKSDISVGSFGLAWTPWRVGPDGIAEEVFSGVIE